MNKLGPCAVGSYTALLSIVLYLSLLATAWYVSKHPFKKTLTKNRAGISNAVNLQATKLFIVTLATKGGRWLSPLRFSVRFKILYRVIYPLLHHCLLSKMAYLNVKYVIATRNYYFLIPALVRN